MLAAAVAVGFGGSERVHVRMSALTRGGGTGGAAVEAPWPLAAALHGPQRNAHNGCRSHKEAR